MFQYNSIFISDIHLGTRNSQVEPLLEFLRLVEAETIYLVGDIIDFWKIKRKVIWPQTHNDVVQKLLRKVRKGTRIVFIPGNHDDTLRDYCGYTFGGIEIQREAIHITSDGRRYKILHGDEFDVIVRYAQWLAFLGDRSYEFALFLNVPFNWIRRHLGFGFWSLSGFLKYKIKTAVQFISDYEKALVHVAKHSNVDGVICGHIHHPSDRMIDGIHYLNCGDWVESCTVIAELPSGKLQVLYWKEIAAGLKSKTESDKLLIGSQAAA